jgi:hypothetical protein
MAADDIGGVDTMETLCLASVEFSQPDANAVIVSETIAIHEVRIDRWRAA